MAAERRGQRKKSRKTGRTQQPATRLSKSVAKWSEANSINFILTSVAIPIFLEEWGSHGSLWLPCFTSVVILLATTTFRRGSILAPQGHGVTRESRILVFLLIGSVGLISLATVNVTIADSFVRLPIITLLVGATAIIAHNTRVARASVPRVSLGVIITTMAAIPFNVLRVRLISISTASHPYHPAQVLPWVARDLALGCLFVATGWIVMQGTALVQTGLGRTGVWFEHQRAGITPDIVTVAKGLGGGRASDPERGQPLLRPSRSFLVASASTSFLYTLIAALSTGPSLRESTFKICCAVSVMMINVTALTNRNYSLWQQWLNEKFLLTHILLFMTLTVMISLGPPSELNTVLILTSLTACVATAHLNGRPTYPAQAILPFAAYYLVTYSKEWGHNSDGTLSTLALSFGVFTIIYLGADIIFVAPRRGAIMNWYKRVFRTPL